MSFIIVWGTLDRRMPRGVVLDVCGACRRITPSTVFDHFTQPHLYGIGYGAGTYITTTRNCQRCRESYAFVESAYDDILAVSAASGPDAFERLLHGTNKKLASIIDIGNRMRALVDEPPYRGSAGEGAELLRETLDLLETLMLRGLEVRAMFDRVGEWDSMTDEERRYVVERLRDLASNEAAT